VAFEKLNGVNPVFLQERYGIYQLGGDYDLEACYCGVRFKIVTSENDKNLLWHGVNIQKRD
jgi:hypothetical protein